MDQENQSTVNINLANAEELSQLQGVGGRLAERIIEARPFESVEDLTRVRGISEKDVERLRPFLTISEVPEQTETIENEALEDETEFQDEPTEEEVDFGEETAAEVEVLPAETEDEFDAIPLAVDVEGADETVAEEVEVESIDIPDEAVAEETEPVIETTAPPAAQPPSITRGGACGLIFLGGIATLVLAVVITLAILSGFNNGRLTYASPYQIAALKTQVESLSTQAEIMADDIDGLRTRMDNLESLSAQVSEMQTEFSNLQEEIVDLQAIVASNQEEYDLMVARIDVINEDINNLGTQNERFEGFFEGLRSLMENLFPVNPEAEEIP
jgi:competence ComEA-like helix-hairpin-helix protein